ncbi:unnamed protein product [Allacma fusca]|uniref:Uncharacterized protein n=1 Tax=Allacma fusca TaxID=39272 RepID=A0A8J2PIQ8_9HEXA|nr:unnamed protein product [Allacma fusca]
MIFISLESLKPRSFVTQRIQCEMNFASQLQAVTNATLKIHCALLISMDGCSSKLEGRMSFKCAISITYC